MSESSVDISKLVEVLFPILENHIQMVKTTLVQEIDPALASGSWYFIKDEKTGGELKSHQLEAGWDDVNLFFHQEKPLLFFIEKPLKGLVNKKAKFWLFSNVKVAISFFKRQPERPKEFKAEEIRSIPYVQLNKPLAHTIRNILMEKGRWIQQIMKVEDIIKIVDLYLKKEDAEKFGGIVRKLIRSQTLEEVRSLKEDVTNPGVSPTLLEKRLSALFRLSRRYFIKKNDVEREYLNKLLSAKVADRKNGLKLVEMRLGKMGS